MYKKNYTTKPGFNLPINLNPKPNRVNLSRPARVNGVLTAKVIK